MTPASTSGHARPNTSKRRGFRAGLVLPAFLAAGALVLSACGSDSSDSGQEAPEAAEQTTETTVDEQDAITQAVVVYSGRNEDLVGPLFAQFTEETGIPVSVRYGDTAELAAQIIEEGNASPADLYFGQDAGALGALDSAGLCAPLPEAIAETVPASYRSQDGTWTGVTGRARVIAYDSSRVSADEVPTSVFELTDPKWKGEVAIAPTNGSFQAFVTAMRVSAGDDVTREWLQGLVDNDAQLYEKNGLIRDAVDAGQVKLGLINHYYWYQKASEVGEDAMNVQLAYTEPGDPGTLVNVAGACVITPSQNQQGAGELLSWMLSNDIQQWFVENTYEYPLVPGVAGPAGVPSIDQVQGPDIPLAELEDLPGTLRMLQDVGLT
jgi:iron(III) transport system substrate-binding protein